MLAEAALASNMGFLYFFNFPPAAGENLHWISLPYSYAHTNAEALCQDLGGAATVKEVRRWDEVTSQFVAYTCGSGTGSFTLIKGHAYGVVNALNRTIDAGVAGSHDDAFVLTLPPTAGSNLTWISIPFHLKLAEYFGGPTGMDAEELCLSLGAADALAIITWDEARQAYISYACGSVLDVPFLIIRKTAYGVINKSGRTISWRPPHY